MSPPMNLWAAKVLAKPHVSIKQGAWAFGCAKKGSDEEQLLFEPLIAALARELTASGHGDCAAQLSAAVEDLKTRFLSVPTSPRANERVLFLDDDPERHEVFMRANPGAVQAWTFATACELLAAERFDLVYLDRDLNDHESVSRSPGGLYLRHGPELSGEDVAKFIASQPLEKRPARVVVHSWNEGGAERMVATLRAAGVSVTAEPFVFPPRSLTAEEIKSWSGAKP